MIKLDCTKHSVVITCDECGHWYGFAFTRHEGLKTASRHEERCHANQYHSRDALRKWEERHAA